jgi:hypothetical protein
VDDTEPVLKLYRGDVLLAVLSNIHLYDWPWYICDFQPTIEFEPYRVLFERELELLEGAGATEAWDLAYGKIEDLKLTIVYPGDAKVSDQFMLHIDGEQARFKVW